MHQVKLNDMDAQLQELVERVRRGEDVVITQDDDTPIVRLVTATNEDTELKKKRPFGSAKGLIRMSDDFDEPLEDFEEYM